MQPLGILFVRKSPQLFRYTNYLRYSLTPFQSYSLLSPFLEEIGLEGLEAGKPAKIFFFLILKIFFLMLFSLNELAEGQRRKSGSLE